MNTKPMPSSLQPKRLHVRFVAGNKFSVGEYLRAKWYNVCNPFKVDDKEALAGLAGMIETYKRETKREVELVSYSMGAANELQVRLNQLRMDNESKKE